VGIAPLLETLGASKHANMLHMNRLPTHTTCVGTCTYCKVQLPPLVSGASLV